MVLVPVGVTVVIGVILFGGPAEALEAVNALVREVAQLGLEMIHGVL